MKPIEYYSQQVPFDRHNPAEYHRRICQLNEEFKQDLFAEYGVTNHPKAERVFELAYQYGHSAGYSEVMFYFGDLVQLIRD